MTSRAELERQVAHRAANRCEYCRMHQSLQGASFHLEHVVPISRWGESELGNLAWSCPGCNLRKSNRIEAMDPDTGSIVVLFHPRTDLWKEHFAWDDYQLVGSYCLAAGQRSRHSTSTTNAVFAFAKQSKCSGCFRRNPEAIVNVSESISGSIQIGCPKPMSWPSRSWMPNSRMPYGFLPRP